MPKPKEPALTLAEQHKLFRQTAREIGTDEFEDPFDKVLRKVASAPPPRRCRSARRLQKRKKR